MENEKILLHRRGWRDIPDNSKINQGPVTLLFERAKRKDKTTMEKEAPVNTKKEGQTVEEPEVIEEIVIEELSIDGVCGVY